jgi:pyruvate carboxylase
MASCRRTDFADACASAGIAFIGPNGDVMRQLGNKVAARNLAERAGVPVVPATPALPIDLSTPRRWRRRLAIR